MRNRSRPARPNHTPNILNQITSREVPGAVDVFGVVYEASSVTVNGYPAQRVDEYFYRELEFPNDTTDRYEQILIDAGHSNYSGHAFLAQDPEVFVYDLDGNLESDGRFTYTWDGDEARQRGDGAASAPRPQGCQERVPPGRDWQQNRLAAVETRSDLSSNVPRRKLEFAYDYMGRRIQKKSYTWSNGAWALDADRRFVWVEWTLIAEADENLNIVRSYLWGLDLAEQTAPQRATPHRRFFGAKAGGVGGLLAVNWHSWTITTYPVSSDANGNVVAVGTDTIFEYDPFGKLIRATGPMAQHMPFRFSTKYFDTETGLSYYGYRYYSAGMGRWVNRDPVNESGSMLIQRSSIYRPSEDFNKYGFVGNDSFNRVDVLGQWFWVPYVLTKACKGAIIGCRVSRAAKPAPKPIPVPIPIPPGSEAPWPPEEDLDECVLVREVLQDNDDDCSPALWICAYECSNGERFDRWWNLDEVADCPVTWPYRGRER